MTNYHQPLIPGETYHLFSRAVGNEKLFRSEENYRYFLEKLNYHLDPVLELYTYSLLPNHFHLLVKIRSANEIIPVFENVKKQTFQEFESSLPDFVMKRCSNWLNGYAKAYNKLYQRKGALFLDYLKRSHAATNRDFTAFLFYVHKNAVHHGYVLKIGEWPYDGYNTLIGSEPTNLLRKEVIDWFGDIASFVDFHSRPIEIKIPEWMALVNL